MSRTLAMEDGLLGRIAGFARLLRRHDFIVGLGESSDAARIASEFRNPRTALLRQAFRALYCSRASDWKRFDALFDSFWLGTGMKSLTRSAGSAAGAARPVLASPSGQTSGAGESGD